MLFKPGSTGNEVRLIQSFLKKLGFKITSVDGEYGEETKSAVAAYQKSRGIDIDGWVGNHTLLFLKKDGFVLSEDRGAAVSTSLTKSFISDLIEIASRYEDFVEIKSNSQWDDPDIFGIQKKESDYLKAYMNKVEGWTPGAPYCAAAVGAFITIALEKNKLLPDKFLDLWTAHVMTNVRYLHNRHLISITPSLGSIWLARYGSTDSGHTGIVVDIQGDNIITIEGNTSSGPTIDPSKQRSGDGIYKRKFQKYGRGLLRTQGFLSAENVLKFFVS